LKRTSGIETSEHKYGERTTVPQRRTGWLDRELDYETAPGHVRHKLYDLDHRKYDAATAQFLSVDPLWPMFISSGSYVYCTGDAVNKIDPWGLGEKWPINPHPRKTPKAEKKPQTTNNDCERVYAPDDHERAKTNQDEMKEMFNRSGQWATTEQNRQEHQRGFGNKTERVYTDPSGLHQPPVMGGQVVGEFRGIGSKRYGYLPVYDYPVIDVEASRMGWHSPMLASAQSQSHPTLGFMDELIGPMRWVSTNVGVPVGTINTVHSETIRRLTQMSTQRQLFVSGYLRMSRLAGSGFAFLDAGVHFSHAYQHSTAMNWALFGASFAIVVIGVWFPLTGLVLGLALFIVEEGLLDHE
jgi:RHS repeat-associated protein